jgi:hypothetical protein
LVTTKAERRKARMDRRRRRDEERYGPTLAAAKRGEDIMPAAHCTETTHVQRFDSKHRPITVKVVTGCDDLGGIIWETEVIVQPPS